MYAFCSKISGESLGEPEVLPRGSIVDNALLWHDTNAVGILTIALLSVGCVRSSHRLNIVGSYRHSYT